MLLVQLVTSFVLIWTCQAGVASHEPQTLQTALNLFDWLSGVSSNAVISKSVDVQYHDRAVTKCPPNVMFVLDGSDSVSPIGFTYSKSALVREIRSVTQIFSDVHIGVILFGSVTEEIAIVPRTPKEIESLVDQVNKLNQPRTTTAFSSALRRARTLLLAHSNTTTAYNGDQEGNIIVILSDGKTNSQNNYDIKRATIQEAKMAQNAEMLIISLSPEEADLQFLQEISQVVQEHRTAIFWSYLVACPARVIPSVSKDSGCRDLMFVVDLSDSMIKQKEIVRQYLAYIALRYRHVTNAVGVVMYSSDPSVQFNDTRIELMEDKYALADKIRSHLKFPSTGAINSDKVILESINILDLDARSRPNTLVFLTDGPPLDIQATRQAFQSAQLRGYSVLILRVGTSLSDTDLNQMTSGLTGDVYSVNNFTELYPLDLERSTCQTGNCMSISTECGSPFKFDKTTCSCVCPNECPNNKIHNANCSCVCPNKCPTGRVQDINCNCVCTNTCPLGKQQDAYCNCGCPNICQNGRALDSNCNCVCPSTCSSGKLQDANCNCVCPNTCPSGKLQDANCNCVCPNTCSSGKLQDANCNCVCPNTCPSGKLQDANCNCVCPSTCSSGKLQDANCNCVCPNTCPLGRNMNSNCNCVCPSTCSSGKLQDANCNCVCPNTCPSGKLQDAYCNCVCPSTCSSGKLQDTNCNCVCPNKCPSGKLQDANCNCVCPNTCPLGRNMDSNCNCVCPNTCPSGKLQDANCNCVCPNTCPSGKLQDANCNCVCPNTCPSGKLQDSNCNCVCPNTCPSGKLQDSNCNCVCPNTCPSGKLQDANCNCVCPNTCPSGRLHDSNCNCACLNTCPSGKLQDSNCNCVCPNTCPSGKLQDSNCNCVCPNTCPSGKLQDANCNCVCPNTCPSGKLQDANCNCICPNACEVGKIQDTNCNCVCPSECPTDKNIDSNCNCVCPKTCPPGQVLSNSCQCKCIDTQQSPHERCGCVPVCQGPYVYNYNTCSCADLCDNCYYDNGNYYAGLPGHCDMYVNCIPNGNYSNQSRPTSFTPRVMSCPPGTYYITRPDGWKGCDFLTNGVCFADLCRTLPPFSKYSDPTACQIYWQCTVDKVVPSKGCCEAGQAFDEKRQTCVTNKTCSGTCSLTENSYNFCPYDVTPYNPNEFFYKSVPWAKLICLPGFVMDLSVCRCVSMPYPSRVAGCEPTVDIDFEISTDNEEDQVPRVIVPAVGRVGNFSGNQDLTLKMFAGSGFYTNYFQINLKLYLPNVPTGAQRMAVVTNADCNKRESVSITLDNKNLYFKIYQSELDQAAEVTLPYSGAADGNGWYSIILIYKKVDSNVFELTGQVGNITQTYGGSLRAYIATRNCALHLGYGFNYTSLVGYTDNFQVWRCNPNNNLE
ncbi:balbiani ring protein 3-like isoform X4 [Biomphalaria glabrata]|uniref:Balbiani ring protein 3-like isoform X4 n=1 Tax=Biomphalaria glabrata TaxID=6526 RepID=A0A9W2YEA9_BIOGL|nr:balbiani ring protein 3-like isoform X4 [Biomphalaria glabrata]